MTYDFLGCVEIFSIARGYRVADAILKRYRIELLEASALTNGKFLLLFAGDEEQSKSAFHYVSRECEVCASSMIANPHADLLPAMYSLLQLSLTESLGIFETYSVSSALILAQSIAVESKLNLIDIRTSRGLGDKSVVLAHGSADEIEMVAHSLWKTSANFIVEILTEPHPEIIKLFSLVSSDTLPNKTQLRSKATNDT